MSQLKEPGENVSKQVGTSAAPNIQISASSLSTLLQLDDAVKGDSLQQISTNVLPPYHPESPPPGMRAASFEVHCCSYCGDTFTQKSSLKFHIERRSVLIKLQCDACIGVRIFYNRCALLSHVRAHADKDEPADIRKATVRPLPRVLMEGIQTEIVSTLEDEYDEEIAPATDLLEFSVMEGEQGPNQDKSRWTSTKVKCLDCNEEFADAQARKEHLINGDQIPVMNYQCNKCGLVCPSKCCLKAHQRLHLQVSPYICPECGESPDAYWANFVHHVKFKCFHQARSVGYKCPVCKRFSPSTDALKKHMELHTERYLKCEACPRAYTTKKNFEAHMKQYHSPGKSVKCNVIFKCSLCEVVFLDKNHMSIHRQAHLKEQICEYVFNCMQCGKAMENKVLLLEHIKLSHPKIYQQVSGEDTNIDPSFNDTNRPADSLNARGGFMCMLCLVVFPNITGCKLHIGKAHVNINQPCSYCFMIIANRKEMVQHGKKHLGKGNIVCLLCNNKKCPDESTLESHLCRHIEKMEECAVCPLCFETLRNRSEALSHLKSEHNRMLEHPTNTTPPSEQAETASCHFCRKSFADDDDLQVHLRENHNVAKRKLSFSGEDGSAEEQRPEGNTCVKCNLHSSDREEFKQHIRTHKTNKSSFQCLECGECFVVESSLMKHLLIIHKISDPKKYIEQEGTNFSPDENKTKEVLACDSLICNVCFTPFQNEKTLKTHMRSHGMAFIQANKIIFG